jgi:hypothetical protein
LHLCTTLQEQLRLFPNLRKHLNSSPRFHLARFCCSMSLYWAKECDKATKGKTLSEMLQSLHASCGATVRGCGCCHYFFRLFTCLASR